MKTKYLTIPKSVLFNIIITMNHASIFITSREKMHPTGISLYDELLSNLEELYENNKKEE